MSAGNMLSLRSVFAVLVVGMLAPSVIAETLYVDGVNGNDVNPGTKQKPLRTIGRAAVLVNGSTEGGPTTIKIGPGVYTLTKPVIFKNKRAYTEKQRLTIEATVLPDEPNWKPVLMPAILSTEIPQQWEKTNKPVEASGLKIEINHVTIRGLKFLGSPVLHIWYYPVFREGKNLEDLTVTQCLFAMDEYALSSNVAILANGHGLVVDHCVFYNCRNPAVFWNAEGGTSKNNAMRYCIVDGAYTSGVWVCQTAEDFEFHHNIITRSRYAWMRNSSNRRKYRLHDCIITDNECYSGECGSDWKLKPTESGIVYEEKNVIKTGKVVLERGKGIDLTVPRNFLHPLPGTLGSDLGAGVFTKLACEIEPRSADSGRHTGQLEIQFIGNAAFHITDGKTTLLIDFPYQSGAYGYMQYKMEDVKPIEDGLSLITHRHLDHWDQDLFEKMDHAIIAPPEILENVKSDKKLDFNDVMTYKDLRIQAFETPHDPPGEFQHYSYLVTWHDLRLYIPGAAVVDYALTMKDIDIMFLGEWYTSKIESQEIALDAQTLIIFHQKEGQEIPSSPDYLVLKQGEELKVKFKQKEN